VEPAGVASKFALQILKGFLCRLSHVFQQHLRNPHQPEFADFSNGKCE